MKVRLFMIIPLCFMACVGNVQQNKLKSNTTLQRASEKIKEPEKEDNDPFFSVILDGVRERKIDSTHIWNRIFEAMCNISEPDFKGKPLASTALQKIKYLGQEKKVRDSLSPLLHPRDTFLFLSYISLPWKESVCFWKKIDDKDTLFSDRYTFFYVYYRKEITSGKDELCDSVRLYSKSSFGSYKKEFLSACNRWDTVSLKTNKTLDWGDGDNVRRLAYRVIIKQGGQFSIQYVRIIPQVDSGEGEVIREYTVIIDE